ncbi:2-hydroxypent-2,4-dienoate hydratase [compost metagenome]
MFYQDGQTIPTDKLIVPRVEVELAFVLGKPLRGPDVSLFDVLDATDYVVPALELIDGRSKYPRRIVDNIADNAACAGIVLGGRPVRPMDIDLRWVLHGWRTSWRCMMRGWRPGILCWRGLSPAPLR